MPDLEFSVSDVADDRRSRPLTLFETPSRSILDVLGSQAVGKLTKQVLPGYLMERRWYAAKDSGVPNVGIANSISLGSGDDAVILILDVTPGRQPPRKYLLPVSVLWDAEAPSSAILAEVEHDASRGVLVDAFADDRFIRMLLARIGADRAKVRREARAEGDVGPDQAAQHLVHVGHDRAEIEHLWVEDLLAAEGEQLARQVGGPHSGLADLFGLYPLRVIKSQASEQQLG